MSKKSREEFIPITNPEEAIGQRVQKKSGRPFKSSFKTNTVKAIIPHPVFPDKQAFVFNEDASAVLVDQCQYVDKHEISVSKVQDKKAEHSTKDSEWKLTTEHGSYEVYTEDAPGEVLQIFGHTDEPEVKAIAHLVVNAPRTKKAIMQDHDLLLDIIRHERTLSDDAVKKIGNRLNELKVLIDKTNGHGNTEED